jgi:hypothetical protein
MRMDMDTYEDIYDGYSIGKGYVYVVLMKSYR